MHPQQKAWPHCSSTPGLKHTMHHGTRAPVSGCFVEELPELDSALLSMPRIKLALIFCRAELQDSKRAHGPPNVDACKTRRIARCPVRAAPFRRFRVFLSCFCKASTTELWNDLRKEAACSISSSNFGTSSNRGETRREDRTSPRGR